MSTTFREQIRKAWAQLRGRAPDYSEARAPWDEQEPPWPPEEDSLVPTGPRKTPPLASAETLPLPEPENWDVDALGKTLDERD